MEKHLVRNEFPPVYDMDSRILILGSLPSEASRAAGFYYMNPRNRFWGMLSALLGEDYVHMGAEDKARALRAHGIALSDVILSCEIHRSADASIENAVPTDVHVILHNSRIKRIFLNGGKAYELFKRYFPELIEMATPLPSTSPANARSTLSDLLNVWGDAILPFLSR
ncbi:MAG: DNA-deoxyinosine glycosylase [Clostridia bacterium]|nr:DNA-deoxyinosine glycosylase [Clostridia bacterium]